MAVACGCGRVGYDPLDRVDDAGVAIAIDARSAVTCAVASGVAYCWGKNDSGQLGDGTTTDRSSPVPVIGLPSGAIQVAVAGRWACAIATGGDVWCWGAVPGVASTAPSQIAIAGATDIDLGTDFGCATNAAGLQCWGRNSAGQPGNGTTSEVLTPALVPLPGSVSEFSLGASHTCAVLTTGASMCWGSDSHGQLGINSPSSLGVVPIEAICP